MEAYSFICHNYVVGRGDWIVLVGFSRGAFTVRCIADLIAEIGLLEKGSLSRLPQVHACWFNQQAWSLPQGLFLQGIVTQNLLAREETRYPIPVKACVLWDTVSSIGLRQQPPNTPGFVNSDLPANIESTFQALSLHDRRYDFKPLVCRTPQTPHFNLNQCWFVGFHSDVGGGNREECLAHFALAWMISRLWGLLEFDFTTLGRVLPSLAGWTLQQCKTTIVITQRGFHEC